MLGRVGEKKSFMSTVIKRVKNYICHLLKTELLVINSLEEEMVEGKRQRRRRRLHMLDIMKAEGTYALMKKEAQELCRADTM